MVVVIITVIVIVIIIIVIVILIVIIIIIVIITIILCIIASSNGYPIKTCRSTFGHDLAAISHVGPRGRRHGAGTTGAAAGPTPRLPPTPTSDPHAQHLPFAGHEFAWALRPGSAGVRQPLGPHDSRTRPRPSV